VGLPNGSTVIAAVPVLASSGLPSESPSALIVIPRLLVPIPMALNVRVPSWNADGWRLSKSADRSNEISRSSTVPNPGVTAVTVPKPSTSSWSPSTGSPNAKLVKLNTFEFEPDIQVIDTQRRRIFQPGDAYSHRCGRSLSDELANGVKSEHDRRGHQRLCGRKRNQEQTPIRYLSHI
jgi:hypothetical protein